MLIRIVLGLLFMHGLAFSQDLPQSLFLNTEFTDLETLLSKNEPVKFSQASETNLMTLSNVIELAVLNNKELAQSKKELDSTKALYIGSIQDFYVPELSATFGMSLTDYFGSSNALADKGMYMNFVLPSITLSKTVFNGFGTMYSHKIAKENYLAAQNSYTNKIREVVLDSVTRYYDQILKQEEVQLAVDRLKQLKSQLEFAQINFRNGRVSDYDVAQAQSQFYAAQPEYYRAEKNRLVSQEDFYRYIGWKEKFDEYLLLEGDIFSVADIQFSAFDEQESLNFILTNDSALSQLRTSFENAKNQKGVQRAAIMPKIDLSFNYNPNYGANVPASEFRDAKYEGNYSFGASLRVPILDWIPGTGAASKVKSANEQIKKAEFALFDAEQQKIIEVKSNLLTIRELKQSVEALKVSETQSKRAFEIAQRQYRNGRITLIELNQTQNDYNNARSELLLAVYNEFSAKLFLQSMINNLPLFVEEIHKISIKEEPVLLQE
ncbi:MAG: TolC family protein [Brevinema sp.]